MSVLRCLQGNPNRARTVQDLVVQAMAAWDIGIVVMAEPNWVADRADWHGDASGDVAVITPARPGRPAAALRERGNGFVACDWEGLTVVGIYFSPNRCLTEFKDFLAELGGVVTRVRPKPSLVLGDFNAKSHEWGNPRNDARGRVLSE